MLFVSIVCTLPHNIKARNILLLAYYADLVSPHYANLVSLG